MDCNPPGSFSMGFPKQEHWSGYPFPSAGDLPNPWIESRSPALQVGFSCAQLVKNPSAKQEMQVQSLGGEDTLEGQMAAHSSVLAWEIPWTEEPGWLQSMRLQSQTLLHD